MDNFHYDLTWSLLQLPYPLSSIVSSSRPAECAGPAGVGIFHASMTGSGSDSSACHALLVLLPKPGMVDVDASHRRTVGSGFGIGPTTDWTISSSESVPVDQGSPVPHSSLPPLGMGQLPTFGQRTEAAKFIQQLRAKQHAVLPGNKDLSLFSTEIQPAPGKTNVISDSALTAAKPRGPSLMSSVVPPRPVNKRRQPRKEWCGLCWKNGETPKVYRGHRLHSRLQDGTVIVTCPVLRQLRCEFCGATGDFAHTRTRCPQANQSRPLAVLLKQTPRRCDGSLR